MPFFGLLGRPNFRFVFIEGAEPVKQSTTKKHPIHKTYTDTNGYADEYKHLLILFTGLKVLSPPPSPLRLK